MKKVIFIPFMVIAVLGLASGNAKGKEDGTGENRDWTLNVTVVNSAETPVIVSVDGNGAQFNNGGYTCILQPGQSDAASVVGNSRTLSFSITYDFYDGTEINQSISYNNDSQPINIPCTAQVQAGLFSASAGTFVDETFPSIDIGDEMAQWMGLHGVGEKIVGGLIDYYIKMEEYNPKISEGAWYNFSITIGQQNYSLENLACVAWNGSTPPPVTLIQGQQMCQYIDNVWSNSEYLNNNATLAAFDDEGNAYVGTTAGQVVSPYGCTTLRNGFSVVQLSCAPSHSGQYVAALSDQSVMYFDGQMTYVLEGPSAWNSVVVQMCVNWDVTTPVPQVLCGLANAAVLYYDGISGRWDTIQHANDWGTSVMQLSAAWDSEGNLQAVAGLGNGAVEWWNGLSGSWTELHDRTSWANPVYQLNVSFNPDPTKPPAVLVELFNGAINYFSGPTPASAWTSLLSNGHPPSIIDMHWCYDEANNPIPVFLMGDDDGGINFYQGGWYQITYVDTYGNPIQYISANWDNFDPDDPTAYQKVPFVYCCNYQFTYVNGSYNIFNNYPPIPSADSLCGDLDGDGKDDLASVVDSKWYIWYSTKQYQERSGPYDLGIQGTPLVGDIDGDGQDDFIMVDGSKWYAWLSSMRHNWHSQRIVGDLGVVGKPLTGDLDGDGQDDLIMVMGSLWYVWPSSLDYAVRIGPFDTGIRGLPATGDLNGDGLADMITVVGKDWYICYSISPGQYGPWCGPYDVGISGAPATGDLNGDGLVDMIIVVGSNWYVCFATSSGQYGAWYGPFAKSVL